jgi:hypothetical protein
MWMKKVLSILLLAVMMAGCSAVETFEKVEDELQLPAGAQMAQVMLQLPADAAAATWESEAGQLYLCQDYYVTLQVMEAGNLDRTLQELTGFDRQELALIHTRPSGTDRYDCVWTAAGEGGDQIGRAVVVSDGNYHYCLTTMGSAADTRHFLADWEKLFASFYIV